MVKSCASVPEAAWKQAHRNHYGQKGPCPPNIGDLCFDHRLLDLIIKVQGNRQAAIAIAPTPTVITLPFLGNVISRRLNGSYPFSPSSFYFCSPFGRQILKTRTFKNDGINGENQRVTTHAEGKS